MLTILVLVSLGANIGLGAWVFTLSRRVHDLESVAGLQLLGAPGRNRR